MSNSNSFRSKGFWPNNAAEALEAMKNVEHSKKKTNESKGNSVNEEEVGHRLL